MIGIPSRLSRRGAKLLNLQCWLWGQDIKHTEGNLLLQIGVQRLRPPSGMNGCSQYTAMLASGAVLKLWGFGIYFGAEQGCYLNRYEFIPRRAARIDCWTPAAYQRAPRGASIALLPEALRWIANYERWVLKEFGSTYRMFAAARGPDINASLLELERAWKTLANDMEHWLTLRNGTMSYRQEAHRPARKNSCSVARNPLGSRIFKSTAQPSSSNILSHLLQ